MYAKPARSIWRPAGALSGGQQATAGLGLLFAFQALFRSPFYLLDEVRLVEMVMHLSKSRLTSWFHCTIFQRSMQALIHSMLHVLVDSCSVELKWSKFSTLQ
jgi:hypothetical protein